MKLLKVIKNPVTDHLPVGCRKIAFSYTATKVVNPRELVPAEDPVAIVIGAMAHGKVSTDQVFIWQLQLSSQCFGHSPWHLLFCR